MHPSFSIKHILLSILYIGLLIPFAFLLHYGILLFCNYVVFELLTWFNELSLFWKLILLFLGGTGAMYWLFSIFMMVGGFLSQLIFSRLPRNYITMGIAILIFLLNVFIGIRAIWLVIPEWNFWFVLEFILLAWFVICANLVLLPIYDKE